MSERARGLVAGVLTVALAAVVVVGLGTRPPESPDRVEALATRLRCPTCRSVSVADSPDETARAMREEIARQVAEGRSDQEILGWFVDRYGEWVLLDAPPRGRTLPLWAVPAFLLAVGLAAILSLRRSRERSP